MLLQRCAFDDNADQSTFSALLLLPNPDFPSIKLNALTCCTSTCCDNEVHTYLKKKTQQITARAGHTVIVRYASGRDAFHAV
jgi:hypothetical protein